MFFLYRGDLQRYWCLHLIETYLAKCFSVFLKKKRIEKKKFCNYFHQLTQWDSTGRKGILIIVLLHCSHPAVCGCPDHFVLITHLTYFRWVSWPKCSQMDVLLTNVYLRGLVLYFSRCLKSQSSPLNIMPICHISLINNISVLFIPLFVFSGHTAEGGVIGMACVEAVLHFCHQTWGGACCGGIQLQVRN